MFRLTPVVRITLALVLLTTPLVLSADLLNLIPNFGFAVIFAAFSICKADGLNKNKLFLSRKNRDFSFKFIRLFSDI